MVLGAVFGFLVAEDLLLNTARSELRTYAAGLVVGADSLGRETADVLAAVEQSPHPSCSEADIAYMQGLLFQAHFLKDIGRLQNNAFVCTARLNRIADPRPIVSQPTVVTERGLRLYRNDTDILGSSLTSAALYREVGVMLDDGAFFNPPEYPMRYTTFSVNAQTGAVAVLYGSSLSLPTAEVLSQREGKRKDALYTIQCSTGSSLCQMTSIRVGEVLREHQNVLFAFAILGACFGVSIAIISILFMRRQSTLDKQLRRAVRRGQLHLVYQPIVELPSGRIVGAEALIRWKTVTGEYIAPDVFIPVAESGGFIGEITRLVIHRTTSELGALLRHYPHLHISINFSAYDLSDPDVLQGLDLCLDRFDLLPDSISIEITERITSNRATAHDAISQLRKHGHKVFIDDFGTGYSSLSYLNDLNVDGIKIDRAFTATIGTEAVTAVIVPQILKMAELLNLAVVIEGVETEAQVAYFSKTGRPMLAQGWYFSKPVSAEELIRKVNAAPPSTNPANSLTR